MRGVRCEASTSLLFPQCVRWGKSANSSSRRDMPLACFDATSNVLRLGNMPKACPYVIIAKCQPKSGFSGKILGD